MNRLNTSHKIEFNYGALRMNSMRCMRGGVEKVEIME